MVKGSSSTSCRAFLEHLLCVGLMPRGPQCRPQYREFEKDRTPTPVNNSVHTMARLVKHRRAQYREACQSIGQLSRPETQQFNTSMAQTYHPYTRHDATHPLRRFVPLPPLWALVPVLVYWTSPTRVQRFSCCWLFVWEQRQSFKTARYLLSNEARNQAEAPPLWRICGALDAQCARLRINRFVAGTSLWRTYRVVGAWCVLRMKIFDSGINVGSLYKLLESPHATRNNHRGDHGGDDADYDRRSCVFRFITCKG